MDGFFARWDEEVKENKRLGIRTWMHAYLLCRSGKTDLNVAFELDRSNNAESQR
jgi:hypothetical protein